MTKVNPLAPYMQENKHSVYTQKIHKNFNRNIELHAYNSKLKPATIIKMTFSNQILQEIRPKQIESTLIQLAHE